MNGAVKINVARVNFFYGANQALREVTMQIRPHFVTALIGLQPSFLPKRNLSVLLAALATGGLLFTGYLTYLEAFVIHAWCRWCLGSAGIITVIWVAALAGVRQSDRPTVRP